MKNYFYQQWILLFSHSGSEAAALVEGLNHQNNTVSIEVFTNQSNPEKYKSNFPVEVPGGDGGWDVDRTFMAQYFKTENIWSFLRRQNTPTLVTCHGFNRIIPSDVLANPNLEIYNMHPGDTMSYPILVGKDPQEKAITLNLPHTGVMLHKVTEELDGGPLYGFFRRDIKEGTSVDELVSQLKEDSLNLWFPFLVEKLNQCE